MKAVVQWRLNSRRKAGCCVPFYWPVERYGVFLLRAVLFANVYHCLLFSLGFAVKFGLLFAHLWLFHANLLIYLEDYITAYRRCVVTIVDAIAWPVARLYIVYLSSLLFVVVRLYPCQIHCQNRHR